MTTERTRIAIENRERVCAEREIKQRRNRETDNRERKEIEQS